MKKMKKILLILTLFLTFTFTVDVNALDKELRPGEVTGSKKAEIVTGEGENGRKADITITVEGEPFNTTTQNEKEIVLVLDASGSMGYNLGDNSRKTRIDALKEAAENFIDSLLQKENKEMIKIGIVYYATDAGNNSYCNLTTEKTRLMTCLNRMRADGGTNVEAGLKSAKGLFSDSTTASKVIVVLSDGIPTYYGSTPNIHGTGNSDSYEESYCYQSNEVYEDRLFLISYTKTCYTDNKNTEITKIVDYNRVGDSRYNYRWNETVTYENEKYKPSYNARLVADEFKRSGGEIYSLGFAIEQNSDAEKFLKTLASSENNYFLASSFENLKNAFATIVDKIDLVATNVKVEDIIPDKFEIDENYFINTFGEKIILPDGSIQYGDKIIVSQVEGGTKLTWLIGNVEGSSDGYSLTFRVKAKDDYYGNMFTNAGATITGEAVEGHPIYGETNPLEIELKDPTVPIPAVTEDDKYTTKQGETLTVDSKNGVRKNDYKQIQNDDGAIVVDEVVKVVDVTKGLLTLNKDGSFTYKTPTDYVGDVTFTYYIETTVKVNSKTYVVKSNISTVTITIEKEETTYVVRHYEENTTNKVADDEIKSGNVYEKATGNAKTDLIGWVLVGTEMTKEITLDKDASKNIMIFYYKKLMGKVIAHYVDEEGNTISEDVITTGQANVDDYLTTKKTIANYVFKEIKTGSANESGKYTDGTLEVTYVYKKLIGKVTVRYIDKNTNEELLPSVTTEAQVGTTYETIAQEIPKYELVGVEGEETGEYIDGELVITYIYVASNTGSGGDIPENPIPNTGVTENIQAGIMFVLSLTSTFGLVALKKRIFE